MNFQVSYCLLVLINYSFSELINLLEKSLDFLVFLSDFLDFCCDFLELWDARIVYFYHLLAC